MYLTARLSGGERDVSDIELAFSACDDPRHPVCRLNAGALAAFTTGSMISHLARGQVRSWVSPGPPSVAGSRPFSVPA